MVVRLLRGCIVAAPALDSWLGYKKTSELTQAASAHPNMISPYVDSHHRRGLLLGYQMKTAEISEEELGPAHTEPDCCGGQFKQVCSLSAPLPNC